MEIWYFLLKYQKKNLLILLDKQHVNKESASKFPSNGIRNFQTTINKFKFCYCISFCKLLLFCGTRAYLFSLDKGSCYDFSTENKCLNNFNKVSRIWRRWFAKYSSILFQKVPVVMLPVAENFVIATTCQLFFRYCWKCFVIHT